MKRFEEVPAYPCDVRIPATPLFQHRSKACIYEGGVQLIKTMCCGRYFPHDEVVNNCGWCSDRWASAYAVDPVFSERVIEDLRPDEDPF